MAGRCGPGTRIPFLVISPYAKKNYVSHVLITQASIPQFIEDNWLKGERLGGGSFDATTGSIVDMFNFNRSRTAPKLILDPTFGTVDTKNKVEERLSLVSMFNRTIVWFLGAGLLAGAVFAAEPQTSARRKPESDSSGPPPGRTALRDGQAWQGHILRHQSVVVGQDGLRVLSQPGPCLRSAERRPGHAWWPDADAPRRCAPFPR